MEWQYFNLSEFTCKCNCETNEMDLEVVSELDRMRLLLGFPLIVTSGYRCPNHLAERRKSTGPGPHTTGHAVDILLRGARADKFLGLVYERGFFTGKGFSQRGNKRFIHVDNCESLPKRPRPHIWSY